MACGRRWGKTILLKAILDRSIALQHKVLLISASDDLLFSTLDLLKESHVSARARIHRHYRSAPIRIDGSLLHCFVPSWENTPDDFRGSRFDQIIIDEMAFCRGINSTFMPGLMNILDIPDGIITCLSTPARYSMFNRLATFKTTERHQVWNYPTWDNLSLDHSHIALLERDMGTLRFREEFGAEILDKDDYDDGVLKPF